MSESNEICDYEKMNKTTMEHNTAGYPHPQPPPEYTPNPLPQYTANSVPILQPPVITQQPGRKKFHQKQSIL